MQFPYSARMYQALAGMAILFLPVLSLAQTPATERRILLSDSRIVRLGRFDGSHAEQLRFAYPGTGVRFRFHGSGAQLQVVANSETSAMTVVVDSGEPALRVLKPGENMVTLASGLDEADHTVAVYKRTETWQGIVSFTGITLDAKAELLAPPPVPTRKLMFVGDSVTCGTGVNNNVNCSNGVEDPSSDVWDAYGLRLSRRLDAETHLVCYGGRGLVRDYRGLTEADGIVNAPQFLDLAIPTDPRETRVSWDVQRFQPDAIVVSLGTNDMNLQKTKPLDEEKWVAEYVDFVKKLRGEYPKAILLLTNGAIVTDPLLEKMIRQTVEKVAEPSVRFVAGVHYPGNGCDGHPTRLQHAHMADDLEPVLRQALGW